MEKISAFKLKVDTFPSINNLISGDK